MLLQDMAISSVQDNRHGAAAYSWHGFLGEPFKHACSALPRPALPFPALPCPALLCLTAGCICTKPACLSIHPSACCLQTLPCMTCPWQRNVHWLHMFVRFTRCQLWLRHHICLGACCGLHKCQASSLHQPCEGTGTGLIICGGRIVGSVLLYSRLEHAAI